MELKDIKTQTRYFTIASICLALTFFLIAPDFGDYEISTTLAGTVAFVVSARYYYKFAKAKH